MGEIAHLYPRRIFKTTNLAGFRINSLLSRFGHSAGSFFLNCSAGFRELLVYHYESLPDFVQQPVKPQG